MADPFLAIGPFTTQFGRALTAAEAAVATRLLSVVSDWIRDHAPAPIGQLDAEQVVFEVVRDSINFGDLERFSQFLNTTAHRTESGTLDPEMKAIDDYLTKRHKRLLGIFVRPAYYFGD